MSRRGFPPIYNDCLTGQALSYGPGKRQHGRVMERGRCAIASRTTPRKVLTSPRIKLQLLTATHCCSSDTTTSSHANQGKSTLPPGACSFEMSSAAESVLHQAHPTPCDSINSVVSKLDFRRGLPSHWLRLLCNELQRKILLSR